MMIELKQNSVLKTYVTKQDKYNASIICTYIYSLLKKDNRKNRESVVKKKKEKDAIIEFYWIVFIH